MIFERFENVVLNVVLEPVHASFLVGPFLKMVAVELVNGDDVDVIGGDAGCDLAWDGNMA